MANPKITKQWFSYAARDLRLAQIASEYGGQFKNETAFHVQQCIEKAMKGYLVFHDVRPPKIHKIEELAKLIKSINPQLATLFRGSTRITQYAVVYRYPDAELRPITVGKVKSEVKLAQKVYDRLLKEVT